MNGEYEHVRYALLLAPRQCIVERSGRLGEKNIFSILFCGYFLKLFFVAWIHIIKTEIKTIKVRPQCGNVFIFSGGVVQWDITQVWQVPQKNIFQAQLDHRFQYFAQRGNSLAISETLVLLTTSPAQAGTPPTWADWLHPGCSTSPPPSWLSLQPCYGRQPLTDTPDQLQLALYQLMWFLH